MHTDPIADYLTRVRNAIKAHHKFVNIPSSKMKKSITDLLISNSFVSDYEEITDGHKKTLRLKLKYNEGIPVIRGLKKISKPGLRIYASSEELPKVFNGLGIAVISTSSGIISDIDARKKNIGGEVLCYIW